MNEEISKENKDFYKLLWQSEFSNLISTKDLSSTIFYSLIKDMDDVKLKNKEFMDLYLCEKLFSTLLAGLESLSKNVEKLMTYSDKEGKAEVSRFNACNYLAEFLMRNNPKYGKNQETHQKFLKYTRKERKTRMAKNNTKSISTKIEKIYKDAKIKINKMNITNFVTKVDGKLELDGYLPSKYDWIEHFRVYKDDQEISLHSFLEAFNKAVLEIHEIDEKMLEILLQV